MTDLTRVSSLMVNHAASGAGAVSRRLSAGQDVGPEAVMHYDPLANV